MKKLGKKQLTLHLLQPLTTFLERFPTGAGAEDERNGARVHLRCQRGAHPHSHAVAAHRRAGIGFSDLQTRQSSLEDIFVSLVSDRA
jgi:ABC-2 type transport system ATP-binding protein